MRFSFRYKLALFSASIVLGLLGGTSLLIQTLIEENALDDVKNRLIDTQGQISRLIELRETRLGEIASGLRSNELIRLILIDPTLDAPTRNDIIVDEILPAYPHISLLGVADSTGSIRAINDADKDLSSRLAQLPFFKAGLDGTPSGGFFVFRNRFVQTRILPLTVGNQEIIGAMLVGIAWSQEDLRRIKTLSRTDIAFYDGGQVLLATGIQRLTSAPLERGLWEYFLDGRQRQNADTEPTIRGIGDERFLFLRHSNPNHSSPPFIIVKSLDRQLYFATKINRVIAYIGAVGMMLGMILSFLLAQNVSRPVRALQVATQEVEAGNLSHRVHLKGRDEFARLGSAFNQMVSGLEEKERMRRAMAVADEIQKNLLPNENPRIPGLEIANRSIYCSETGGDYFDFLVLGPPPAARNGFVIGDVSGHGIEAALLMTTARAMLRSRVKQTGSLAQIVGDVNRSLAEDVWKSGHFMTLFLLEVNPVRGTCCWVRAGHDPAIVYDPGKDAFHELNGPGMALGVNPDYGFQEMNRDDLTAGQTLVMGTDGIWETRSKDGRMFGKDGLQEIIREHAVSSAAVMADAVIDGLDRFRQGQSQEDDVTVVIVKLTGDETEAGDLKSGV